MNKLKNFSFRTFFANKRFTIIFSFIVAFIFWLVITVDQTPIRQSTVREVPIVINVEGSYAGNRGLSIVSEDYIKYASVKVEGPNYIVSSLRASDILVSADISGVTEPGVYTLSLTAQPASESDKSGYTCLEISPSTIEVAFDRISEGEIFPVEILAEGITVDNSVDSDIKLAEPEMASENNKEITVSGPNAKVSTVSKVVAKIEETEKIGVSKTYDAAIILLDKDGNEIDKTGLTLSFETVKVIVPVNKVMQVPVIPTFENDSEPGAYTNVSYTIRANGKLKSFVTVEGPPDVVTNMSAVELEPIDVAKITNGKSFNVKIDLGKIDSQVKIIDPDLEENPDFTFRVTFKSN